MKAVQSVIAPNGVYHLQMTIGSHNTSGKDEEKERMGMEAKTTVYL